MRVWQTSLHSEAGKVLRSTVGQRYFKERRREYGPLPAREPRKRHPLPLPRKNDYGITRTPRQQKSSQNRQSPATARPNTPRHSPRRCPFIPESFHNRSRILPPPSHAHSTSLPAPIPTPHHPPAPITPSPWPESTYTILYTCTVYSQTCTGNLYRCKHPGKFPRRCNWYYPHGGSIDGGRGARSLFETPLTYTDLVCKRAGLHGYR